MCIQLYYAMYTDAQYGSSLNRRLQNGVKIHSGYPELFIVFLIVIVVRWFGVKNVAVSRSRFNELSIGAPKFVYYLLNI